jgi:hypothetical protein
VLQGLVTGEETAALLIGHVVELGEAIEEALLVLLGKLVEAGLVLKGALLLIGWEIAMAIHPLGEMLLVGFGADGRFGRIGFRRCGLARHRHRAYLGSRVARLFGSHEAKRPGETG